MTTAVVLAWALAPLPVTAAEPVTFSKDVAPIVFEHCAQCHRPGGIGPFSLLTYRDARQRMRLIVETTARRLMPPWKPLDDPARFVGARTLTDEQIQRLAEWAAQDGPEGDPRDLPAAPSIVDGWQLGTPDQVVEMSETYTLRADGPDTFRIFVLPVPTTEARYVRAIEFRPGNDRAVHHANLGVDRTGSSRRLDAADPEPGYSGGMSLDAGYPPGYLLGWTPGQQPHPSPAGMPWRLEAASDLVAQLHLQPTGRPEAIRPSVGFYFTDDRPTRAPVGLRLGSETIDIPPGEASYVVSDEYVLPVDTELLAVQPHAHNLGREMQAQITRADGRVDPLLTIRDWDFRWQDVYYYAAPIQLPKGSRISMRFTYDNSAQNPRNPFQPPQRVVWGQNTSDEMGDLWIQLVAKRNEDAPLLAADIAKKTRAEDIAAFARRLEVEGDNPLRRDGLAMLYMQDGKPQQAIEQLEASLRLNPYSAPTHYNIGVARFMLRQYPEAVRAFEEAIQLDPAHAQAHNNLGAMLHLAGKLDEAAVQYRRAAELNPDNAEAHSNLGRLLMLQDKKAEAIDEFERALALEPEGIPALLGLSWLRATSADAGLRRGGQAVALAERARKLSGNRDAAAFDALAAGYAALGEFEQAVHAVRLGMQLADAAGLRPLWEEMRERLQLYEQGKPYIR
ncbi:MAG: tetratricopeptide repeat protein [Vicinamibacterales bacterium]